MLDKIVLQPGEKFVRVDEYDRYMISNKGRVWSTIGCGKFLKGGKDRLGYIQVQLSKGDGSIKHFYIHQLVGKAFIPNPQNLPYINHRDEDKTNNCVENLEWCDAKYNHNYSIYQQEIEVGQYDKDSGELINTYKSSREAERQTGTAQGCISACCNGKQKTSGGYVWKYLNPPKDPLWNKKRPILKIDPKSGKVLARYDSSMDAARHLVLGDTKVESAARRIKDCLDGILKTYKEYIWRYAD